MTNSTNFNLENDLSLKFDLSQDLKTCAHFIINYNNAVEVAWFRDTCITYVFYSLRMSSDQSHPLPKEFCPIPPTPIGPILCFISLISAYKVKMHSVTVLFMPQDPSPSIYN